VVDVSIKYINATYCKIISDPTIISDLKAHFSHYVPGYQFIPSFKNRLWDGKIRFLNNKNLIYTGLLSEIIKYCNEREYSFECQGFLTNTSITDQTLDSFLTELNLKRKGKELLIRDYQKEAIKQCLNNMRQSILSPTASGKSLIIYCIYRFLLKKQISKIVLIVPRSALVYQMYNDIKDYCNDDPEVMKHVYHIFNKKEKETSNHKLIITTWQSLKNKPQTYLDQFEALLQDECHALKAPKIGNVIEKLVNANYRYGFSGTLDGKIVNELTVKGLTGDIFVPITTREMIDNSWAANLIIKCVILKHNKEVCKQNHKIKYQDEVSYLIHNQKRNALLSKLVLSLKGNSLILFNLIEEHAKELFNKLQECVDDTNRKVYLFHDDMKNEMREQIRQSFENENDAIILASYSLFSEGINIENLENVIFAFSTKSVIRLLQSVGRGLRIGRTGKVTIYDCVDDMSWKTHKNYTLKHFLERVKIYDSKEFDYKLYNIEL